MIYINSDTNELSYWGKSPVLNATTEDEIFEALQACVDKTKLREQGRAARAWVSQYNWESLIRKYLVYAELATGIRHFDYGVSTPFGQT